MTAAERRARFRELHAADTLFVMPNPWDAGSAKLLAALGFEALATTSAGFAWSLGKLDQTVTRDELVAHVETLAQATPLPLNVDSERCYPDAPGGVAETVRLLADAGAAGCSIEDYDPATGAMDDVALAAERVAEAAEAAQALDPPLVLEGVDRLQVVLRVSSSRSRTSARNWDRRSACWRSCSRFSSARASASPSRVTCASSSARLARFHQCAFLSCRSAPARRSAVRSRSWSRRSCCWAMMRIAVSSRSLLWSSASGSEDERSRARAARSGVAVRFGSRSGVSRSIVSRSAR